MPDLNDFYAFKMTTSDGNSGAGRNSNNGNTGNGTDGSGCATVLIILAIAGWVLWFIGK